METWQVIFLVAFCMAVLYWLEWIRRLITYKVRVEADRQARLNLFISDSVRDLRDSVFELEKKLDEQISLQERTIDSIELVERNTHVPSTSELNEMDRY